MTDETSGIVGNTRNAQSSGTKTRKEMKEGMMNIPRVVALVVIVIIFILLLTTPMSIFWKLVSGGTLFYLGSKLGKVDEALLSKEVTWKFPIVLKVLGVIMFASTLLTSGASKKIDEGFTYVDECLKGECPESSSTASTNPGVRYLGQVAYSTNVFGTLAPVTIRPGQSSQKIANFGGGCVYIDWMDGSDKYVIWSEFRTGPAREGMITGAVRNWIEHPDSETEPTTIIFSRKPC